jgi:hypothetical protein
VNSDKEVGSSEGSNRVIFVPSSRPRFGQVRECRYSHEATLFRRQENMSELLTMVEHRIFQDPAMIRKLFTFTQTPFAPGIYTGPRGLQIPLPCILDVAAICTACASCLFQGHAAQDSGLYTRSTSEQTNVGQLPGYEEHRPPTWSKQY